MVVRPLAARKGSGAVGVAQFRNRRMHICTVELGHICTVELFRPLAGSPRSLIRHASPHGGGARNGGRGGLVLVGKTNRESRALKFWRVTDSKLRIDLR